MVSLGDGIKVPKLKQPSLPISSIIEIVLIMKFFMLHAWAPAHERLGGYDVNITLDSIINCKLSELRNNKPVYVYAIVSWILHYSKEGDGLGFPFDLPYVSLYERCCKARKIVERLILLLAELKMVYKPLVDLKKILMDVDNQEIKLVH